MISQYHTLGDQHGSAERFPRWRSRWSRAGSLISDTREVRSGPETSKR